MTATDKLRRMLDERGVEWWKASPCKTKWHSPVLGGPVAVREWNGKMVLDAGYVNVTPEQAVAATLGNGECEIETTENWLPAERYHRCKHCGAFFAVMNASGDIQPCVCPNCGKAVKR